MAKNSKYMDRALKSRDPRYARVLSKLGYNRRDMKAEEPAKAEDISFRQEVEIENYNHQREQQQDHPQEQEENLTTLRAKYKEVLGKQPYYGWDEEELRKRINEAS